MEAAQRTTPKGQIRWDTDVEKKLIEVWATILRETDGKMMTRKKKEAVATQQLNEYMKTELQKAFVYTEKDVHNQIDSML